MSAIREDTELTPWPAERSGAEILRALAIGSGILWSVAFVALALSYELQLYADGAMFSYALAAQDVWAFHWHNISGRLTVFLLTLWPAELYVDLTGSPWSGIVVYGFLFYLSPLVGLVATFFAEQSRPRTIFSYACFSTALLCPLVFGFPTEMWIAHALFWPTLAVAHRARRNLVNAALLLLLLIALVLTHEGALVLAATVVATLALRGLDDALFRRAGIAFVAAIVLWGLVKMSLPPGDYFAGVLMRAALHFFDFKTFESNLVVLLLVACMAYGIAFAVLSRMLTTNAHLYAAMIVAAVLAVYWLTLDHTIHAANRYYMRTALVIVTPILSFMAALDLSQAGDLIPNISLLSRMRRMLASDLATQALAGALLLVTLVHVVETEKFIFAWERYKAVVKALALGTDSDPSLGDPHFVSSGRIGAELNRLSWSSTTQYLGVILSNFSPTRLVIDQKNNYFWLSCATATASYQSARAIPAATRGLIKTYSCQHR